MVLENPEPILLILSFVFRLLCSRLVLASLNCLVPKVQKDIDITP